MLRDLSYRDRSFWRAADSAPELQYLGWGHRRYDRSPTAPRGYYPDFSPPGFIWSYNIILRGSPTILLSDGQHPLGPDQAVLVMYNGTAPVGYVGAPGSVDLLNWIWRTPPVVESLRPGASGYVLTRLTPDARRRLAALHRACRAEIARPDEHTPAALGAMRAAIDIELARSLRPAKPETDRELTVRNAIAWIERNLHRPNAVGLLCDYLQVARSTLNHLFIEALNESPSDYHHRLRMTAGKRMIEGEKLPAKVAALNLGYKHPSDFSRAYKAYFGVSPGKEVKADI